MWLFSGLYNKYVMMVIVPHPLVEIRVVLERLLAIIPISGRVEESQHGGQQMGSDPRHQQARS